MSRNTFVAELLKIKIEKVESPPSSPSSCLKIPNYECPMSFHIAELVPWKNSWDYFLCIREDLFSWAQIFVVVRLDLFSLKATFQWNWVDSFSCSENMYLLTYYVRQSLPFLCKDKMRAGISCNIHNNLQRRTQNPVKQLRWRFSWK